MRSYYRPKSAHTYTATLKHYREILQENPNSYRIQNAIEGIKRRLSKDEKSTRSKEYLYTYVVHYDHNKYLKQKQEYENGDRKSKPNGHRSCYIPIGGRVKTKKEAVKTDELKRIYETQTNRFNEGHYHGEYEF